MVSLTDREFDKLKKVFNGKDKEQLAILAAVAVSVKGGYKLSIDIEEFVKKVCPECLDFFKSLERNKVGEETIEEAREEALNQAKINKDKKLNASKVETPDDDFELPATTSCGFVECQSCQ
jgi:hypothetical protein